MAVAVRRYADLRNARQAYSGDLLQGPPALGLLAKASAASHMHELFSCPTWAGCYQLGCAPPGTLAVRLDWLSGTRR